MIRNVRIQNFKSIPDLSLDLGRVNVLIGANGSGKSNILEAITLALAAVQNKLDNEFLSSRGVRIADTRFMRSAFQESPDFAKAIQISVRGENDIEFACGLVSDDSSSYPKWMKKNSVQSENTIQFNIAKDALTTIGPAIFEKLFATYGAMAYTLTNKATTLPDYLVYAPENSALRTFQDERQILPLGIRGEGLFAHLKGLSAKHKDRLEKIKERLTLIDWFEGFDIPGDLYPGERSIRIRDRHLPDGALFDQRSANEGFLFLLFYLTLLISPETPAFFAIDNVDTSLNPKLCIELVKEITTLAKEYDKQVILTTHNPAILDGLDLHDDEQRLLVVDRNKDGHTRVVRIDPPKPAAGELPVSLSTAFMRGYIGGLPNNF